MRKLNCRAACAALHLSLCILSHGVSKQSAHRLGGFGLRKRCDVSVRVKREASGVVTQHPGDGFDVHAVLQRERCECVPLRYNYDKPEKPRISRVFGYLARFFILFQTEKSSREVVIS